MMKRLYLQAVLLCCVSFGCSKTAPQSTIIIDITADHNADEVVLLLKSFQTELEFSRRLDTSDYDLYKQAFRLQIDTTSVHVEKLVLFANGMVDGRSIMGGIKEIQFVPQDTLEISLHLFADYVDDDGDGFPAQAAKAEYRDCDDTNASIHPYAQEICNDDLDNNCIDGIDEGCPCPVGETRACYPADYTNYAGIGICSRGLQKCLADGTWGDCLDAVLPAQQEICGNTTDDNCDGSVNEGCPCSAGQEQYCWLGLSGQQLEDLQYRDQLDSSRYVIRRALPPGSATCAAGIQTCINNAWSDCSGAIAPTAYTSGSDGAYVELHCDGVDEDCDGKTDENGELAGSPQFDADGDSFKICSYYPDGNSINWALIDCDDNNPNVNPAMLEICNNGTDEDCRCNAGEYAGELTLLPHVDCLEIIPEDGIAYSEADLVCSRRGYTDTCAELAYYAGYDAKGHCHLNGFDIYGFCKPDGNCAELLDVATLCVENVVQGAVSSNRPHCQKGRDTSCLGTIPADYASIARGEDPFGDCVSFDCSPYFWGWLENVCYLGMAATANYCDGAVDSPDCLNEQLCSDSSYSGRGEAYIECIDAACRKNASCMLGEQPMTMTPSVGAFCFETGTTSECNTTHECAADGACLLMDGQICPSGEQCSSTFCVDDYCCDQQCDGICRECDGTGMCHDKEANTDEDCNSDIAPANMGSRNNCEDPPCVCTTGGVCSGSTSSHCSADTNCASGHCECTNDDCSNKECTPNNCVCGYGQYGVCGTALPDESIDDPDCGGTYRCDGYGTGADHCKLIDLEPCAFPADCLNGYCECGDENCSTTVCWDASIQCQYVDGSGAVFDLADGTSDPLYCSGPCKADGSHTCSNLSGNGENCSSDAQCESGNCECIDASCSGTICSANPCYCGYDSDGTGCNGSLSAYVEDPGDCTGSYGCDGGGACKLDDGNDCDNDSDCISNDCSSGWLSSDDC